MFIDTHCHLSKKDYKDIDKVIQDANLNQVSPLIVSCCDKADMEEVLPWIHRYPKVYYTFGFHPSCAKEIKDDDLVWLEEVIKSHQNIVGVGEIGLDYHYGKDDREEQKVLLEKQLQLAERLHLPVVIHARDATQDMIEILKKYSLKGVIHCFSGSRETASIYLSLGYYLGIGGVVTFTNSHLGEVVKALPLDKIVLETDSPYLAPVPLRGSINEPKNIPYIAEAIANSKEIDCSMVEEITTKNARQLFDLPE